ncbi:aldose epimerase family protein [Clostridium sp. Ade.TY]|uniref:aldose epimerase family protein n=1 Tax=Clostridium sp. Ade.TY TaxID=1391647 RepID=UPI00040CBEA1|nr:aldose epimerase family protein [Clostridium sp. Ade.TY]
MRIDEKKIAKFNSDEIKSYTITNSSGFSVTALNYGAIITDIMVKDKNGKLENVVMKYNDINDYKNNPSYFGALIGRTSGRVCDGKVLLNEKELSFNKNYGLHQGHGGDKGFDKKIMDVKTSVGKKESYIEFSFISKDNEEGYPGNLKVKVRYTITEDCSLKIDYNGISDKDTLLNLTNHSYFNLSGYEKSSILEHYLYVDSDYLIELDETQVPTGNLIDLSYSPFDFIIPKTIGRDIEKNNYQLTIGSGYDHPWMLHEGDNVKARLWDEASGRCMDIYTNQKALVLYSLNFPDDKLVENGKCANKQSAIAIETQSPPIGRNNCFIEDSIISKNKEYKKQTIYKFYIKE